MIVKSLQSAIGILRNDSAWILEVAEDKSALVPGLLFVALSGFLRGLPQGL
jgi:hypothetical protein